MPQVKIEDKEYDYDLLPDVAKKMMQNMQFVDAEISRMTSTLAVMQTARNTYFTALKESLAQSPVPLGSDTIKLG